MIANEKLLFTALGEYGRREVPGPESDPSILSWIRRFFPSVKDDGEVNWCGIFMSEIARRACAEQPRRPFVARSWLLVGLSVATPLPGDVVIFWRGGRTSWKGHVGIFCRQDGERIWVLGGNQASEVNIRPYHASKLLGFRRLQIIENEDENVLG